MVGVTNPDRALSLKAYFSLTLCETLCYSEIVWIDKEASWQNAWSLSVGLREG